MKELENETRRSLLKNVTLLAPYFRILMRSIFFPTILLDESGYVEEEIKMVDETRKILRRSNIRITATCVRVPVLRAHSEALE